MLSMRPERGCSDRDRQPETTEALTCSIECTFCEGCASGCSVAPAPLRRQARPAGRDGWWHGPRNIRPPRVLKAGGCTPRI